jgi:hypothetical protein
VSRPTATPSVAASEAPAPASIGFKLIGIVETPGQTARVAVLSDDQGVYHGHEGDIIEGRYRIVRIDAESVEMSHVNGDGRQTIYLSGS